MFWRFHVSYSPARCPARVTYVFRKPLMLLKPLAQDNNEHDNVQVQVVADKWESASVSEARSRRPASANLSATRA